MNKKYIISLEGGEGAGKTTVMEAIKLWFEAADIPFLSTREPGGVCISEKIREIILNKEHLSMDPRTEALLFAAARRQHLIEKVLPALEEGKVVIFDRYVDSSLVYQGYVRGMGMDEILNLNQFAIEGLFPDLTMYFDLCPEIGLSRINASSEREVNRLDLEALDFHKKVREGYLKLNERFDRFHLINGEQSLEKVIEDVKRLLIGQGILKDE